MHVYKTTSESSTTQPRTSRGRVIYATTALASLLGFEAKSLIGSDFGKLMAQPFAQLHGKWIKVRQSYLGV